MFLVVVYTSLVLFILGCVSGLLSLFNISWVVYFSGFNFFFKISFLLDYTSLQFFSVLMIIVSGVFIFSLFYMEGEMVRFRSFFWIVVLFVISMIFLIFSKDWISLILGWDWLGISSFFLVAFYNSDSSWSGSLKTYFSNRLGDGFFLFMLSLSVFYSSFLSFQSKWVLMVFFLFLCQTKSAQLPFSAWLPAAMAAPTPVSALVHSSTLVTAGIFILIRLSPQFTVVKKYLLFVGLITLFMGSMSACGSSDMKKVVAFSTLSHLGFMVVCLSSGVNYLAFFHLLIHASFKALLFICVGSLIVLNNHSQDLRHVSFSFSNLFLIWGSSVSVISLCGFPFFSGFFSKDFIMEFFFFNYNIVMFFLFLFSLLFSVFYSIRLMNSFLNMNWLQTDLSNYSFFSVYLLPLLFYSLCSGAVKSSFCFSLYLVESKFCLKIVIYFFLVLGLIFFSNNFLGGLASSISFLDSLGQVVPSLVYNISNMHQMKDLGNLTWLSEKVSVKFLIPSSFFENSLNSNVFMYLFIFSLIFILF